MNLKRMKKLHADGLLESLDYESFDTCEPCLMGKMTKMPIFGTMERATHLLEIIHTDVRGPMNVEAHGGYRYFLTFTCDLSRSMSGEIDTYGITGIPSTVGGRGVVQ